ncbi:hypothetical protein BU17DRAFT_96653 [Hysterangium stoloniferum]|nr:hypothetical protein BU17DRAFT_96653 [Hysterangium stoloniferum]
MLTTRLAVLFAIALLAPALAAAAPRPDFPPALLSRDKIGTDVIGGPGIGASINKLLWLVLAHPPLPLKAGRR